VRPFRALSGVNGYGTRPYPSQAQRVNLIQQEDFMTITRLLVLAAIANTAAYADFSYSTTMKNAMLPNGGDTTKTYLKGNKMAHETGNTVSVLDFDAQTITRIDNGKKTYTVTKFSDVTDAGAMQDMKVDADFKQTDEHKTINGFNATKAVMTMQIDMPQMGNAPGGGKMQMEIETWLSPDVPGYPEMEAFYKRNMGKFPWAAMAPGAGANPSMRATMANMMKKMAAMHGAPVLQVVHMKMAGGPQMDAKQQANMEKAKAQLEAMSKQGGPAAAMAQQQLARINAMSGGSGGGSDTTMESNGFSASSVPDSVFAVPAGYQKQ
jgi:hypothetical protein